MAKKRKKSIRKKIVPFLEPCESSCLKPWCRSGNGLCSQDHLEVSFEHLPQGPLPTSFFHCEAHTPSHLSFPNLCFLPSLPGSACRSQSPLEEDGGIYHMLEDAPAQISQATQLDLESQCQRYVPKLGSWVVARLRTG